MTSAANHKNTRKKYFDAPFSQLFVDLKEPKSKPKPKPEALAKAKSGQVMVMARPSRTGP